ncbi:MAG: glycosyltransferase family 2 protein [Planctomycetota bacterium]|nr:glycosyltransferase family 2 protein [Planctomycetota bacterium]
MGEPATPIPPASGPILSIVIPVYNERDVWRSLVDRVLAADLPGLRRELILVDDGSSDGTRDQLGLYRPALRAGDSVAVLYHPVNRGKGAALRTGFTAASGDLVLVQDADLEYDPRDYGALLAPLLGGEADVVYGCRFRHGRRIGMPLNYLANRALTCLFNLLHGTSLNDMETCYKVFRRPFLQAAPLRQDRFGFEPEITAAVVDAGIRIHEVPIHYHPRSREMGKKITWKDGFAAIACLLRDAARSWRARW